MRFYDAIYSFKDYATEADDIKRYVEEAAKGKKLTSLLDIACGTGKHMELLAAAGFKVEGLDLDNDGNLAVARKRLPEVNFHVCNMINFDLGRRFDVLTCLFSSIGYVVTVANLRTAIANFARHLAPGGVVILEPLFSAFEFKAGMPGARFVDEADIKIARLHISRVRDGNVSVLPLHDCDIFGRGGNASARCTSWECSRWRSTCKPFGRQDSASSSTRKKAGDADFTSLRKKSNFVSHNRSCI